MTSRPARVDAIIPPYMLIGDWPVASSGVEPERRAVDYYNAVIGDGCCETSLGFRLRPRCLSRPVQEARKEA